MIPRSLEEVSLFKAHYTSGSRESTDDYTDLGEHVDEPVEAETIDHDDD